MEADLVGKTEADQIFPGKAGVDRAVEIAVRSLCIRRLVLNAGNLARCLFARLTVSRCIAMFVLEVREKIGTKLPSELILRVILVKEIMTG